MKYTNMRVALMVTVISFLSACATFDGLVGQNEQSGQDNDSANITEQTGAKGTEQNDAPDPFIAKALLLKNQDNQYLQSKADVPNSIREQFAQALALKQQKQYSRATEILLGITQSQPNLSGPWVQLAEINQLQDQDSGANTAHNEQTKSYLQQAIQINPANYIAHNRLGSLLRTEGSFAEAKNHYQLAIKSWPGFAPAYFNLGILDDLYIGDKDQALENYQLYQALIDEPERKVKGWIADLTRQLHVQESEVAKQ